MLLKSRKEVLKWFFDSVVQFPFMKNIKLIKILAYIILLKILHGNSNKKIK